MRNKLLSIMPEFQHIGDGDLQDKTIAIWVGAMEKRGASTFSDEKTERIEEGSTADLEPEDLPFD